MKALTVRQPWASLIALGVKRIETRSWRTSYRGPLAIHAGLHRPKVGWDHPYGAISYSVKGEDHNQRCWQPPGQGGVAGPRPVFLPLGAVVATATLAECLPILAPDDPTDRLPHVAASRHDPARLSIFRPTTEPHDTAGKVYEHAAWEPTDISSQLPLGNFDPGGWAWLLDDVAPTETRCPACAGSGLYDGDDVVMEDPDEGWPRCTVCDGAGKCSPVPAKGRQGLWEWTP